MVYKFVPEISSWKEALLSGHFGPMGVGAVFVSSLALTRLPTPEHPPADQAQFLAATIQPIVSFVVLGSIIMACLFRCSVLVVAYIAARPYPLPTIV